MNDTKLARLRPLDVVRTKLGTIAVIHQELPYKMYCKDTGKTKTFYHYSLTLPSGSKEYTAWYERDELEFISSVTDLVISNGV